jgi:hypothetical protein
MFGAFKIPGMQFPHDTKVKTPKHPEQQVPPDTILSLSQKKLVYYQ